MASNTVFMRVPPELAPQVKSVVDLYKASRNLEQAQKQMTEMIEQHCMLLRRHDE